MVQPRHLISRLKTAPTAILRTYTLIELLTYWELFVICKWFILFQLSRRYFPNIFPSDLPPSHLPTFSTSFFSHFRIFSRGIVPPYRTTTGPTSHFQISPSQFALRSALCTLLPAPCPMPYAPCALPYALCSLLPALCPLPYAPCSITRIVFHLPCVNRQNVRTAS